MVVVIVVVIVRVSMMLMKVIVAVVVAVNGILSAWIERFSREGEYWFFLRLLVVGRFLIGEMLELIQVVDLLVMTQTQYAGYPETEFSPLVVKKKKFVLVVAGEVVVVAMVVVAVVAVVVALILEDTP